MKKIHRFLAINIPSGDSFSISDERIVHQVGSVLRIHPGEEIILFINEGPDVLVSLDSVSKTALIVTKLRINENLTTSKTSLIAAISIAKGDTFELIVQKLTELGVHTIVPIISTRTIKQSVRLERLQKISDEALEQCGGNRQVVIHKPLTLTESIIQFPFSSFFLDAEGLPLKHGDIQGERCTIYIGPEGGWDEKDIALFKAAHAKMITLGPRILRTETAAIVGAYNVLWNFLS